MRVLMIVMSDVVGDARVRKEAVSLAAAGHDVTVLGDRGSTSDRSLPGVEVRCTRGPAAAVDGASRRGVPAVIRWALLPEHRQREQRRFQRRSAGLCSEMGPFDVVHAHDLSALPVAASAAERWDARLVYDAHECWTGRRLAGRPAPGRRWRDRRLERRLGGRADLVVTVSEGIAHWMAHHYGWHNVEVVRNSFPTLPAPPPPDAPRGLLYAGRIDAKRDLTTVAAAAGHLPDLQVTVIGPADGSGLARDLARTVTVAGPVGIDALDDRYRDHGLGLVTLSDGSLNHRLALPNKLFQAIRAGVPVVAADLPEMRRLIERHGLGTLYRPGDPASLVAAVRAAMRTYDELVENVRVARPQLSWERDEAVLLRAYDRLDQDR